MVAHCPGDDSDRGPPEVGKLPEKEVEDEHCHQDGYDSEDTCKQIALSLAKHALVNRLATTDRPNIASAERFF
jgi:hypothetical protein